MAGSEGRLATNSPTAITLFFLLLITANEESNGLLWAILIENSNLRPSVTTLLIMQNMFGLIYGNE